MIGVTLSVAASLAFKALGIGAIPVPSARASGPPSVFRQTITDSFIVYGKRRVGGLLVFFHSRLISGNHYRYFVIACAGHQCKGIVSWMLNDEIVTVDGAGKVTSGNYKNAAWLWFVRGTNTDVANSTFVSETSGKWTANHKGLGVAKIYAKFQLTDDVISAGMPNITAVIEGRDQILDTRDSTLKYTRNAALIFYDWMQIPREEGGFGAYSDEIPDSTWINAQANVADEVVSSEARYSIDAVLTTGSAPADVRDALIVNMAGTYTFSGGKHLMRVGYWVPPSITLKEDDLVGGIQVSPFLTSDAAANEVQGTYIDPSTNYQGAPFTTQSLASPDIRQVEVDLAFTTSIKQADRVAKIMLKRAQAEKTVVWPMNIAGLKARALDVVQLDATRYSLNNYAFLLSNWSLSADYGVVASLREENSDIYSNDLPVTPPTVPTVTPAVPVLTITQTVALINDSFAIGLTYSVSATGDVTISDHFRGYNNQAAYVPVNGTGGTPHATGGTAGQRIYIYYDDPDRTGGAVTYQHLVLPSTGGDASSTAASQTNPYRHLVLIAKVPASGSTGGGSDPGSGGGVPSVPCVTTDTLVQLADGTQVLAGEIKRYMQLRTTHETTGREGIYHVAAVEIVSSQPVWKVTMNGKTVRATANHRIMVNGEWKTAQDLGTADGTGDVVKMTVADAHTYVSNGLLSHNVKFGD